MPLLYQIIPAKHASCPLNPSHTHSKHCPFESCVFDRIVSLSFRGTAFDSQSAARAAMIKCCYEDDDDDDDAHCHTPSAWSNYAHHV